MDLEDAMKTRIEVRLEALEERLKIQVGQKTAGAGGGWFYPFILLALSIFGLGMWLCTGQSKAQHKQGGMSLGL